MANLQLLQIKDVMTNRPTRIKSFRRPATKRLQNEHVRWMGLTIEAIGQTEEAQTAAWISGELTARSVPGVLEVYYARLSSGIQELESRGNSVKESDKSASERKRRGN
jgi:hypothetical protein